ncbi:MAG: aldolase, partial [Chloroflexota bacterium]
MEAATTKELLSYLDGAVRVEGDHVTVLSESTLRQRVDKVVYTAVFGRGLTRETARWLLWELGQALGIYPASIHGLYMAVGRGEVAHNFTVPAMNVRAMNYNTSRAIFRAANKHDVG